MEAIFATIESLLGGLIDPGTTSIVKQILDFIVNFLEKFALIG